MTNTTSPKTAAQNVAADFRLCADGCGAQVTGKAIFRPGHDARFVSLLLAVAADHNFDEESLNQQDLLPTAALRQKFVRAFWNNQAKALAKQDRAANRAARRATPQGEFRTLDADGTVKVGRWIYPARRWIRTETSEFWVERNTQRDGKGEWVDFGNGQSDALDNERTLKGAARIKQAINVPQAVAA